MKVRTLTMIASLLSLCIIATYISFPILPSASYLKIDFSDSVLVLIGVLYGYKAMSISIILKGIFLYLKMPEIIGVSANLLAAFVFVSVFILVYNKISTRQSIYIAMIIATVMMTIVLCVANYFIFFKAYGIVAGYEAIIVSSVLPFNIIKGVLVSIVSIILLKHRTLIKQ